MAQQTNGALAKARKIRSAYDANPNYCLFCSKPILSVIGKPLPSTRIKKFCDRSCSAKHNNKITVSPKKRRKITTLSCINCGIEFTCVRSATKKCPPCIIESRKRVFLKNKGELTHAEIRNHSRKIMKPQGKACLHCGYSKFVEVCHIKPVREFPDDAKIVEINHPDNLIFLCPNCHWEYDHKNVNNTSKHESMLYSAVNGAA